MQLIELICLVKKNTLQNRFNFHPSSEHTNTHDVLLYHSFKLIISQRSRKRINLLIKNAKETPLHNFWKSVSSHSLLYTYNKTTNLVIMLINVKKVTTNNKSKDCLFLIIIINFFWFKKFSTRRNIRNMGKPWFLQFNWLHLIIILVLSH
jgi:hypothetical protein